MFVDSIVFGAILSKNSNLESIKDSIREEIYTVFKRKTTYIKIHNAELNSKEYKNLEESVFR